VTELLPGPTLAEEGSVPLEESRRIARQIAEAPEYAHERGIVHRDREPANKVLGSSRMTIRVGRQHYPNR
jgi:serine/threonine-protein kinase